jgi:hypothetical protein
MLENPEKNAVYAEYNESIDDLVEELKGFCADIYGDKCEFGKVTVEREKDGGSWKLHEYQGLDDEAVQAFRNHLRVPMDIIRIRFGSASRDYDLEFVIAKAKNTVSLSRFVRKEDLQAMNDDQLVVLAVEGSSREGNEHRRFIQSISE